MTKQTESRSLIIAASIALASSSLTLSNASAQDDNPFQLSELSGGYLLASHHGSCGEGKCGMKKMDTDNDGAISKEEFMSHAESRFNRKDTNQDGKLSGDEMNMMHHKMKGDGSCGEGKCGANKSDN